MRHRDQVCFKNRREGNKDFMRQRHKFRNGRDSALLQSAVPSTNREREYFAMYQCLVPVAQRVALGGRHQTEAERRNKSSLS
ncbi:hypothetical protein BaRGS_00016160 [Batillaria attramentaria]|uniref:Uncharacterized protein n=1 Tax=Batillaria attramentaria TaxID=370345 RepID=A0ABD0L0B1_9CAEN